jgi:hypothetical protein
MDLLIHFLTELTVDSHCIKDGCLFTLYDHDHLGACMGREGFSVPSIYDIEIFNESMPQFWLALGRNYGLSLGRWASDWA